MKYALVFFCCLLSACASLPNPYDAPEPRTPKAPEAIEPLPRERPVPPPPPESVIDEPPPNNAVLALASSARSDFERGQLSAASQTLERALRIAPEDAGAWLMLGWVRLGQGQAQQAATLARRAMSLRSDYRQRCLAQALRVVAEAGRSGWPQAWRLYEGATGQCTSEPV